jgi:nitrile hydratase accessory protein
VSDLDLEALLPEDGPGAPPRSNGELLFAAPWQSRIFGLTVALYEQGRFEWSEFQHALIEAIARHEAEIATPEEYEYYTCWLEAFRSLAEGKGWLAAGALEALEDELRARPHGHDH